MKKRIISALSVGVLVGGGLLGAQAFAADSNQDTGKSKYEKAEKSKEVNTANVEDLEVTISTTEVK